MNEKTTAYHFILCISFILYLETASKYDAISMRNGRRFCSLQWSTITRQLNWVKVEFLCMFVCVYTRKAQRNQRINKRQKKKDERTRCFTVSSNVCRAWKILMLVNIIDINIVAVISLSSCRFTRFLFPFIVAFCSQISRKLFDYNFNA